MGHQAGQQGDEDHHLLGADSLSAQRVARLATYQPGKRTIAPDLVQRSLGTAVIFQVDFLLGLFGLCLVTPDGQRFLYLVFEVVSALATVGVTANVTSTLNGAGLGIIMVLMFIGRIRPLDPHGQLNNYS